MDDGVMEKKYPTEPLKIVPNSIRENEIKALEKCLKLEQMNYHQAGVLNPIFIPLKNTRSSISSNDLTGSQEEKIQTGSSKNESYISQNKFESGKPCPNSELRNSNKQDTSLNSHQRQSRLKSDDFSQSFPAFDNPERQSVNQPYNVTSIEKCHEYGEHRQTKNLFEDFIFPPEKISLPSYPARHYVWKRPHEIVDHPVFVSQGKSRFDVQQGRLGNCWFISALATLAGNKLLLKQLIPPDQSFEKNYSGEFIFHFWNFDRWVEVTVDDRLPTVNGQLVFMHSQDRNEFWSALLEKAYAKLYGGYTELIGGRQLEAFVDLSGGLCENVKLDETLICDDFFKQLLSNNKRGSLMGCSINDGTIEEDTGNGLLSGHAYSVTGVAKVRNVRLIRLRNPWGRVEWTGDWCDSSLKWNRFSADEKKNLFLKSSEDGEFWMSFEDFVSIFSTLEICHLTAKSYATGNYTWKESCISGVWKSNINAGGCPNYPETFPSNHQYKVFIDDNNKLDELDRGLVIVGLQQRVTDRKKQLLTIGYLIYALNNSRTERLKPHFFRYNSPVVQSSFQNSKQICGHHFLKRGYYMIIPCTFYPHEEGEFFLRVFNSKSSTIHEMDSKSKLSSSMPNRNLFRKIVTPSHTKSSNLKMTIDKNLENRFLEYSNNEKTISAAKLSELFNNHFREKNIHFHYFDTEICEDLIILHSKKERKAKTIGFEEFKFLCNQLFYWKDICVAYDKHKTGFIATLELRSVLNEVGICVSNKLLAAVISRFSSNDKNIAYINFIKIIARLNVCYLFYQTHKKTGMSKDEFIIKHLTAKNF